MNTRVLKKEEELEKKEWSYSWINELNMNDGLELYPLQFSNVYRIEKNDAVYIFDEVGTGKTISAGMMALNYLNNTDEDVTIITINALVKSKGLSSYGQFLDDWYDKLPFNDGFKNRISIWNNNYKNISKIVKTGLLIIDEAHMFIEPGTEMLKALERIEADKVIFLTATPIKRGAYNLSHYVNVATSLLKHKHTDEQWECDGGWINELNEKPIGICKKFDKYYPVTRYFKDTVVALENVKENEEIDWEKKKARRLLPELWDFSGIGDKYTNIKNGILKLKKEKQDSKFIIFTRLVWTELKVMEQCLLEDSEHFISYDDRFNKENKMTVVAVYGESFHKISEFSHNGSEKELPDIIIVNYQIAEAGVNLPGYNYVINSYISAFPSSLEQRFGRIDRMGKRNGTKFDEIHMVYVLSDERSIINFNSAMGIYAQSLLTSLPAKNILLTESILSRLEEISEDTKFDDIKNSLKNDTIAKKVFEELSTYEHADYEDSDEEIKVTVEEICGFCNENNVVRRGTVEELVEDINKKIDNIKSSTSKILKDEKLKEIVNKKSDEIFYNNNYSIETENPIDSARTIAGLDEYKAFCKEFNFIIALPRILSQRKDVLDILNEYFLNCYLADKLDFEKMYPQKIVWADDKYEIVTDYKETIKNVLGKSLSGNEEGGIKNSDIIRVLSDNAEIAINNLEFFNDFKTYAKKLVWVRNYYEKFPDNPFAIAFNKLNFETQQRIKNIYGCDKMWDGDAFKNKFFQMSFDLLTDGISRDLNMFEGLYKDIVGICEVEWEYCYNAYVSAESMAYDGEDGIQEDVLYGALREQGVPLIEYTWIKNMLEVYDFSDSEFVDTLDRFSSYFCGLYKKELELLSGIFRKVISKRLSLYRFAYFIFVSSKNEYRSWFIKVSKTAISDAEDEKVSSTLEYIAKNIVKNCDDRDLLNERYLFVQWLFTNFISGKCTETKDTELIINTYLCDSISELIKKSEDGTDEKEYFIEAMYERLKDEQLIYRLGEVNDN